MFYFFFKGENDQTDSNRRIRFQSLVHNNITITKRVEISRSVGNLVKIRFISARAHIKIIQVNLLFNKTNKSKPLQRI